jgi:deoxyribodipyrimidine photolyase-related protein
LSAKWYEGKTGVVPVDHTIEKAFSTGYLHHIERLMIMGNYMTLFGISPKEMYKWFMEFSMDSYDWVMIVNVFGMVAHADAKKGPTFTKPYISSSNYVLKMSHYKKEKSWTDEWDEAYYDFLEKYKDIWSKNPRMTFMMKGLEKKR